MRKLRVIKHRPQITIFTAVACIAILSVASGCGGGKDTSETVRAAAISLQQAMNEASRNIDEARGTRSSLDKLSSVLKPSIAQTGDVIVTLTPKAGSEGAEAELLKAAQEQRTFLQYSADAAGATSWKVGKGNLARAKEASRRAVDTHAQIAQDNGDLAGLLPASTTFNLGRLSAAVRSATRKKPPTKRPGANNPSPPAPAAPTSTSDDWPGGSGYTAILASLDSQSVAEAEAVRASSRGLDAGVLYSSDYRSLRPGYWVVFSGSFQTQAEASQRAARAREFGYSDAYPRGVSR